MQNRGNIPQGADFVKKSNTNAFYGRGIFKIAAGVRNFEPLRLHRECRFMLYGPEKSADRLSRVRARDGLREQFGHRDDHHFGDFLLRGNIHGVGDHEL